jgi:DNA invertase Pin-like site-specific DNA recombinase
MTVYGYARVSSKGQSLEAQRELLQRAGCDVLFQEKLSAKGESVRPQLAKLLKRLEPGDVIKVTKLDRFARNLRELLNVIHELGKRGIGFVSLGDPIDTTTSAGRLTLNILGSIAEFERERIRERCDAGIERAKANGVAFGRKHVLSDHQRAEIRQRLADGETSVALAKSYGVSQPTIWRCGT